MRFLAAGATPVAAIALAAALAGAAGAAAPPAAAPVVSFGGLDSRQASVNPADVQVAVGPTAVVQAVNSSIGIWTTAGEPLRQQTLGQFFSGGGVDRGRDSTTDPRVLWDPVAGRFFATTFDITRLELVLAVSTSADPLGPWSIVPQPSSGCTDQPRLGTSQNVVVLTDDLFSSCRGFGRFLGGEIVVFDKQDLLDGVPSPRRVRFGPDARFAAVTPASALSPTPVAYLVAVSVDRRSLQLFGVPDATIASLPFRELRLASPLADTEEPAQRGSGAPVDAGDTRVQNAVFDAGRVWATTTEGCGPGRDCARVVQVDPAAARIVQETPVALPGGRALLYPAAAPDARGNVVVAFSYTSANDFPGFGYTYVRPDGEVAPPVDLVPGSAPQTSGRFGDYSGAARDPADPNRLWLSAEVGQAVAGSSLDWATGIAAVAVPPQAPAVVSAAAAGGKVTAVIYPEAAPATWRLDYGPTTAYGLRTPTAALPAAPAAQTVTAAPAGLQPGRVYHLRVVAASANGTTAGPDLVLRAPAAAPRVGYPAPAATRTGAVLTLRARVTAAGAATFVRFEYGRSRRYGARTAARRVGASALGAVVSARVRVRPGRVYHFRAVASNAKGVATAPDRAVRT